jgi:transposase
MVAELGDPTHFDTPKELMKFLGLVPSAYSSAERRRQGSITKAGNTHTRRILVEGAWAYRYPAKVSRHLQVRLERQPKSIQGISWKAQNTSVPAYEPVATYRSSALKAAAFTT